MKRTLALTAAGLLVVLVIACSENELHTDWPHGNSTEAGAAAPAITLFSPRHQLNANATSYEFTWGSSIPYITTLYISTNADLSLPLFEQDFASATSTNCTPSVVLPLTGASKTRIYWAVKGVDALHTVWSETNIINQELDPFSVVLSEICYRATKSDAGQWYHNGDYLEIHNSTTDRTIDIGNWQIDQYTCDRTNFLGTLTIPYGTRLAPGGFWVLANTSTQFDNAFVTTAFRSTRIKLDVSSSKGFSYVLKDTSGKVHDECDIRASALSPGEFYASVERSKPFTDGMNDATWQLAVSGTNIKPGFRTYTRATPGAANSIWPK
ncbi:MAG TPA: lamin tail domain-containing protein [Spirochaetota bacterium]|nr:lamin tail domain-containing protein [Spirochaetota bacterium]